MDAAVEKPFQDPVTVDLGQQQVVVRGVRQAVECLMTQWPENHGPRHRDALDTCLKVLDGHRSTVDARDAFIAAAEEADILTG